MVNMILFILFHSQCAQVCNYIHGIFKSIASVLQVTIKMILFLEFHCQCAKGIDSRESLAVLIWDKLPNRVHTAALNDKI